MARFSGTVTQTPPIFSAIKRDGVPLYKLARRGDEVAPPPPREVQIAQLVLTAEGADAIRFSLVCSPGTYMRSLARDIGVALDSAAHLAELRRTRSGGFAIEDARPLSAFSRRSIAATTSASSRSAMRSPNCPKWSSMRQSNSACATVIRAPSMASSRHARTSISKSFATAKIAIAEATSRVTAVIARVFNL